MKLRNKQTGEIGYTAVLRSKAIVVMDENAIQLGSYTSLSELNEEWEDAPEEPKEYYFIRDDGSGVGYSPIGNSTVAKRRESIGNYFSTKEEAELAVRKLKAWKRLKDRGFRFIDYTHMLGEYSSLGRIKFSLDDYECTSEDLHLLFGGEE